MNIRLIPRRGKSDPSVDITATLSTDPEGAPIIAIWKDGVYSESYICLQDFIYDWVATDDDVNRWYNWIRWGKYDL